MKVVSIIPARWGSTRFEGKPLADINGKSMIQRVCERAQAARLVDGVTVATDDKRIFKVVSAFGGAVVMTSVDHASGTDRIAEAIKNDDADIIVNVQGDEPLIEPSAIDEAVAPMLADPALQICTLKTRITDERDYRDPNIVKVVTDKDGFALYFSRSPVPFSRKSFADIRAYKHIGLYVYRREFLFRFASMPPTGLETTECLEQLRALENGVRIKVVETAYNPISVDTPEDLEKVRGIFKAQ